MRIALVARCADPLAPHPGTGSAAEAARVNSLAQTLADLGHEVTIYARRDSTRPPGAIAPGVTVRHVTAGPPAPLDAAQMAPHLPEFARRLTQIWRRNPPDLVHAHFWTTGLAALAGAQDLGLPAVQTFGSLAAAEHRHGLPARPPEDRAALETGIARASDMVLASSTEEFADLGRLGVPRTRARMVPCGVDVERFSPEGPVAGRTSRHRLLAAQPTAAARSVAEALAALALIRDAELLVMGDPEPDLLLRAARLGVADRLVFTGPVAPDDLPALLRSADLLVSTAAFEPVGMTAIQAMACGTPVVTTAAGAERDAVVDITTGLYAPPGSPAGLAGCIRQLLTNRMRLEACGIAAADRARSRYSWERIGRETLAAYASCTRRPDAASGVEDPRPHRVEARDVRQIPAGAPV
ncbi:MAG TPA: glycosyltransferase [Streptosporangiaceae bacterium]|nr:glycosyltransferase [Streptosporangiaceae bacterium]